MSKDILFYSNFCTYSKEVITSIQKTEFNNNITYICVDDRNIQLPSFVQAVPTIYLINEKKILVDDEITNWIESKTNTNNNDLMAYYDSGASFSSCFSSIDENNNDKQFVSDFTYLDEKIGSINTPKESDDSRVHSDINKSYEMLQQSRADNQNQNQQQQQRI